MLPSFREKYNYPKYHINKVNNMRFYSVSEEINVPSVTSILRKTRSTYSGEDWAVQRKTDSIDIGNLMHKYLDHYVSKDEVFYDDSSNFGIAKKLAHIIIDNFIDELDEVWGSEVTVLYKDLYAGTIDLIGTNNKKLSVIDYKSSYRKKTKIEMDEYFLQLAAYSIAHDWQHKTNIDSITIFLAIRNGEFEKTTISSDEFLYYKKKWFERLNSYRDLMEK